MPSNAAHATRPWLWCEWCEHATVRHVWMARYGLCCRDCSCTNQHQVAARREYRLAEQAAARETAVVRDADVPAS